MPLPPISAAKLAAFKKQQARELKAYEKKLARDSVRRRAATVKAVKATKKIRARKPAKSIKVKSGAQVRRGARAIGKAARKPFLGGLTKVIAKGFKVLRRAYTGPKKRTATEKKERDLERIGIKLYKSRRRRTAKQKRRIAKLYEEFSEFTGRSKNRIVIVSTKSKDTLDRARKAGFAIHEGNIYVHIARPGESARLGSFMGEKIMRRTYYGKTERIFLGGADTFNRVVKKLEKKPLPKGQLITGAFFGGPTFHRAIFRSVAEFLQYLNTFTPHLPKGVKATKRNIARHRADLLKNIAVVSIDGGDNQQLIAARLKAAADSEGDDADYDE